VATITLVDDQIDAGRVFLGRLKDRKFPIAVACWARSTEEDRWTLYVASPRVDEQGRLEAYREIIDSLRFVGSEWVTSSNVELVGVKNPAGREMIERLQRFSGWVPRQFPGVRIGSVVAEDIYVYPLGEVGVTIYGMRFRGEPRGVLHLAFEPHNPHSTFTIGTGPTAKEYPAETGVECVVAAPQGAKLEQDDIGRTLLAWNSHDRRVLSDAHEVFSLAKLGLHGFRIVREPVTSGNGKASNG
jgi:hypothetical protein